MRDAGHKDASGLLAYDIPEFIICPKCGGEVGLWTGSVLTICWFCGYHVFKKEAIIN
jgi:hypothetical protein